MPCQRMLLLHGALTLTPFRRVCPSRSLLLSKPDAQLRALPALEDEYMVSMEDRLEFAREGVVMLRGVVPELLSYAPALRHAWAHGTKEYSRVEAKRLNCSKEYLARTPEPTAPAAGAPWTPLSDEELSEEIDGALEALRAAEECELHESSKTLKYFQALHLRRFNQAAAKWALNARVASAAAALLGSDVRLYQDGFFRKGDAKGKSIEILNAPTSIHREMDLVPVDTDDYVTAWCPLRKLDTAKNDSALFFFGRSHRVMSSTRSKEDPGGYIVAKMDKIVEFVERKYKRRRAKQAEKESEGNDEGEGEEGDYFEEEAEKYEDPALDPTRIDEYTELWRRFAKAKEPVLGWKDRLSKHSRSVMSRYCHGETYGDADIHGQPDWYNDPEDFTWQCSDSPWAQGRNARLLAKYKAAGYSEAALDSLRENFEADARYSAYFWGEAFDYVDYEVGDCSFHHGWTYHAAPVSASAMQADKPEGERAGTSDPVRPPREAVTMSYINADAVKVGRGLEPFPKSARTCTLSARALRRPFEARRSHSVRGRTSGGGDAGVRPRELKKVVPWQVLMLRRLCGVCRGTTQAPTGRVGSAP